METILFFEPRLLRLSKEKKNLKNGKVWDIDKIKLLRRILDGKQIQLVLTSFNIQKDAALVSLFNSFRIEVYDYFPCTENVNSSKHKEWKIREYPTAGKRYLIVDKHLIGKNCIMVNNFCSQDVEKILARI